MQRRLGTGWYKDVIGADFKRRQIGIKRLESIIQKLHGGNGIQAVPYYPQISLKGDHAQVPLDDLLAVHVDPRPSWIAPEHGRRVGKIQGIVGPVLAECDNGGQARPAPSGAACALLVILPHRGNIAQADGHQRADVDAHLHGGGAAQDVHRRLARF